MINLCAKFYKKPNVCPELVKNTTKYTKKDHKMVPPGEANAEKLFL